MSRIGKQPVAVPADLKVEIKGQVVKLENKKGVKLEQSFHPNMRLQYDDKQRTITVTRPDNERLNRSLHGLTRALIANMVEGLTKGFEKRLKVEGVGFQAALKGKSVELTVGFANRIVLAPPAGVTVEVPDPNTIVVKGVDKHLVGQFAANIRAAKKPEPYKGKGIRYEDEVIRRKEGKSFGAGG
jgi:large subunit ribosomal protein L6